MKSIQTKFIVSILSCVLVCAVVIGGAGVITSKKVVEEDSARILNFHCSEQAMELDGQFARIEQSVETLALYASQQLESAQRLREDGEYQKEYTKSIEDVAVNAANNTDGAVAVYMRYNPEVWPPTSGLFWSKTELNGNFQRREPTDFSSYSPEDTEHVGWYYIPIKKGKASWLEPYMNENIHIYMISYVIPIYCDNETIGVVGMDIDFDLITRSIADIEAYDSGYAFLVNDSGSIMYHKELPIESDMEKEDVSLLPVVQELQKGTSGNTLFAYEWNGLPKKMAFRSLSNGMKLALTVPVSEIDAQKNSLIWHIITAGVCILALSVILIIIQTRRLIRPLRELTTAAKKIAEGDLSVTISHKTNDEVGELADSFRQTVRHLRKYMDYINGLAYRDSMTGVKNKAAYDDMARKLEEQINIGCPQFGIIVFDINGLKKVNDNFGHEYGDKLIIGACRIICQSFKHSPVYRIGGDEFVVIVEHEDLREYRELLKSFEEALWEAGSQSDMEYEISVAYGAAVYQSDTDLVFANVFKRADEAMYENKRKMKEKI